jgi:hypothetical protein
MAAICALGSCAPLASCLRPRRDGVDANGQVELKVKVKNQIKKGERKCPKAEDCGALRLRRS